MKPETSPVPQQPEAEGATTWRRDAYDLVRTVALFLILFTFLKLFIFETFPVQGPSMEPTLAEGDRIVVFKLPVVLGGLPVLRNYDPIGRGDLIVFNATDELDHRYVKRVIAVGGPVGNVVNAAESGPAGVPVEYDDGAVFVDNQRIEETYLTPEDAQAAGRHATRVAPGEYYVLGDHRSVSKDSRWFGPVSQEKVVGRAVFRFWPLSKFGPL